MMRGSDGGEKVGTNLFPLGDLEDYAGNVPAWPCEACDKPPLNGIAANRHDDGNCLGSVMRCLVCGLTIGHEEVNREPSELGRQVRKLEVSVPEMSRRVSA